MYELEFLLAVASLAFCVLGSVIVTNTSALSGGGLSFSKPVSRSGSGGVIYSDTLPVAYTGTLSTRTSDTAGTLTVATGHTIVTGDVFDLYWQVGDTWYVAYGCTAGTVAAPTGDTSIPFTGASGDVLPAQDTSIIFCEQTSLNTSIDGDELQILGIIVDSTNSAADAGAHVQCQDSGSSEIAEIDLVVNAGQIWDVAGGASNPFTGNPITVSKISHSVVSATEIVTVKFIGTQDSSP